MLSARWCVGRRIGVIKGAVTDKASAAIRLRLVGLSSRTFSGIILGKYHQRCAPEWRITKISPVLITSVERRNTS